MTDAPRRSRRMTAPLSWLRLNPGSTYNKRPEGRVEFFTVELRGESIGYLWYSDEEFAAGYRARESRGDVAFNVSSYWTPELKAARAEGLSPSEAVRTIAMSPNVPKSAGEVRDFDLRSAGSVDDLSTFDDH